MFHALAELWAGPEMEKPAVCKPVTHWIYYSTWDTPDYGAFAPRLNTQEAVNMRWSHTGSCQNVNRARCHQRSRNKEKAPASHMHQGRRESPWKKAVAHTRLWWQKQTLSAATEGLKGFLFCPVLFGRFSVTQTLPSFGSPSRNTASNFHVIDLHIRHSLACHVFQTHRRWRLSGLHLKSQRSRRDNPGDTAVTSSG